MKRRNPIAVPLHNGVPRLERLLDTEGDRLAEACARREGQVQGMVARYNVLKSKFDLPYRKNLVTAAALELGNTIRTQTDAVRTKTTARQNNLIRARELATELGWPVELVTGTRDQIEDMERLRAERLRASESEPQPETDI